MKKKDASSIDFQTLSAAEIVEYLELQSSISESQKKQIQQRIHTMTGECYVRASQLLARLTVHSIQSNTTPSGRSYNSERS